MPKRPTPREQKLMEYMMSQAADMVNDALLETCLDQEYRLCILELTTGEE